MPLWKMVNGVRVQMTPEEEAEFEASRAPDINVVRAEVYAAIVARRVAAERAGVVSGGRMIRADVETITRLTALADAASPQEQIPVELVSGEVVEVPAASVQGLITAAKARLLAAAKAGAAKRAEVAALATVDELRAYDVSTGWPA